MSVAEFSSVVDPSLLAVTVGAGDPGSSRLVYAMVIGLVVIGVALIVLAIWLLRQTRPDLDLLAPLERMGDNDWKRRDPSTQRRMLDDVRPQGAEPLASPPPPPEIDADFEQADHPVTSFSDLGPGLGGEVLDPTPLPTDPDQDPGSVDAEEPVIADDVQPDDDHVTPADAEAEPDADGATGDGDAPGDADADVDADGDGDADADGDAEGDGDADGDADGDGESIDASAEPEADSTLDAEAEAGSDEALSDPRS